MKNFDSKDSFLFLFFRLYWIFLWVFPAVLIMKETIEGKSGWPLQLYWIPILVSMISARYVDVKFGGGYNLDGKPSTMKDCKTYALNAVFFIMGAMAVSFSLKTIY